MQEPSAGATGIVNPWSPIHNHICAEASRRLKALNVEVSEDDLRRELAAPPEGMGDVALPLFRWAKKAGVPPDELGNKLAKDFPPGDGISSVVPAGGFLNFHVSAAWLAKTTLTSILGRADSYGRNPPRGKTVCVEHTSTNPTGPLHVGRARNSVVGDTYTRVLRAAGYAVTAHFYVDDVGRQAATLIWLWSKPISTWPQEVRDKSGIVANATKPPEMKPDEWLGKPYPAAAEVVAHDEVVAREISSMTASFEAGKITPKEYRLVPTEILEGITQSLARIGVSFDEFVWESDYITSGAVKRAIDRLKLSDRSRTEEDGALAIDATGYGLPAKESTVFVSRSDGSTLYIARDVAYHEDKLAHFDRVIDILGEDHKLHFRALLALLEATGEKAKPEVFHYSFVNLPEGRMSTRAGRAVGLDDLLNEAHDRARKEILSRRQDVSAEEVEKIAEKVGSGAVRFHLLVVQPDKAITFRWEEALSFEGKSAPFVQYSHARAASLLRKAEESNRDILERIRKVDPSVLIPPSEPDPKELALVKALSRLPSLVDKVAEGGQVHLLALYSHDLAERFNEFYQAIRVMGGEPSWLPFRLALVAATRQVLHNALEIIGVEPLERM
jgi:arginyl-tRNA synthetase